MKSFFIRPLLRLAARLFVALRVFKPCPAVALRP
jgi:hypothetical protein